MAMSPSEQPRQPVGAHDSAHAQRYESPVSQRRPSAESEQPEPDQGNGPCEKGDQSQNPDLCQQWRMAEAAEGTLVWAQRQFWVGVAEAALLILTVTFTALAAWAAVVAARAAERAVDQNERTGRLQLRAYLSLESAAIYGVDDPQGPVVGLTVRNAGLTLADGVCFWGGTAFLRSGRHRLVFKRVFGKEWTDETVLAPGALRTFEYRIPKEKFENERVALLEGRKRLVVAGIVLYFDVFGKDHDINFARALDVGAGKIIDGEMVQWGQRDISD